MIIQLIIHYPKTCDLLAMWVAHSSVVRASYRYLESRGFDSLWGSNFFLSISQFCLKFINPVNLYWGLQRNRCDSILPIWPYIRKRLRPLRIGLGHQYGRGRISLGHQYGGRDVLSKYWLSWLVVFKLRSSNPCRSFSFDNSEFTQQDDRKKGTAERLCVTDVTGLLRMCFVVTFTNLMFSGLLKPRPV